MPAGRGVLGIAAPSPRDAGLGGTEGAQRVSDNFIAVLAKFPVFLAEAAFCGRRETGSERKAERDREIGRECVGYV